MKTFLVALSLTLAVSASAQKTIRLSDGDAAAAKRIMTSGTEEQKSAFMAHINYDLVLLHPRKYCTEQRSGWEWGARFNHNYTKIKPVKEPSLKKLPKGSAGYASLMTVCSESVE